jgi:dipeptidyl aminopeptidase/acylaminoacyl peptidase
MTRSGPATAVAFLAAISQILAPTALAEAPRGSEVSPAKGTAKGYSGHGAASLTPEQLAKYAPPPLPPELSRRLQAVLDTRWPGRAYVAPDHQRLFFEWNVTGSSQVWRSDGPSRFPVQMTAGEQTTELRGLTPDGRYLVLERDSDGEENPGLYLQPVGGGPLREVQRTAGIQTEFGFASDDSRFLVYTANDLRPDSYAIHRFEIATGHRELLFDQPGNWEIADYRAGGEQILLRKNLGSQISELYDFAPATHKLTPLIGQGEREEYWGLYGAKPGELLVVTNRFGDLRRLYSWKDGRYTPLSPERPAFEIEDLAHDRRWRRISYKTNVGGIFRTRVVDGHTYKELPFPDFPGASSVVARPASDDGRIFRVAVGTTQAPTRNYLYDWETRKLSEWALPSAPEADLEHYSEPKLEAFRARDGTSIPMWIQRPDHCDGACPVIVLFHGGPEGRSLPYFAPRLQLFVDAGFTVARPNVRGSEGYGKAWAHADDGAKRLRIITDIQDAANYLRIHEAVGGKAPRMGVVGWSYGGYSALMAMTRFAGTYDAGAALYGQGNLVSFLQNTAPYRRILRVSEYGDPVRDRDVLEQLSPLSYLANVSGPLMLVGGATDPRVPVGEEIQIHDALAARGLDAPLVIFPDEGHGSQKRDNEALEYGYLLQFFERHLQR